jgi:hypothetical protein
LVANKKLDYHIIITNYEDIDFGNRNLFIFTPERALKLLGMYPKCKLDFFFFDEVYKIEDKIPDIESNRLKSSRAIAIRTSLYKLAQMTKKFYIAGPYIDINKPSNSGLAKFCQKHKVCIFQVMFDPTFRLSYEAWSKTGILENNSITEPKRYLINIEKTTLPYLINRTKKFIDDNDLGKTLFYVNYPNAIMTHIKNSNILATKSSLTDDIIYLIQHLKNRYNTSNYADNWTFIKALESGIGIHHGRLPRYIQNEILRLFIENNSSIEHLFCTSTIIEGVNTIAKNVVMVSNAIGNRETKSFSFKNIRGRAGRYYHNFIGRLFYFSKEQKELDNSKEYMKIDFINYADIELSNVDIDNTDIEDLSSKNKVVKEVREKQLNKELLPDEIFAQNRLFDRLEQEKILNNIMSIDTFDNLFLLVEEAIKDDRFIELLEAILKVESDYIFKDMISKSKEKSPETIKKNFIKRIITIAKSYRAYGFKGLLQYQLDESKKQKKDIKDNIDECYNNAFRDLRTTIEFEIPKYTNLFQSLFYQACKLKKKSIAEQSLEEFIKEFEIGKASSFNRFLIEEGYPRDATSLLEESLRKTNIQFDGTLEIVEYIYKHKELLDNLDNFERRLFYRIVSKRFNVFGDMSEKQ